MGISCTFREGKFWGDFWEISERSGERLRDLGKEKSGGKSTLGSFSGEKGRFSWTNQRKTWGQKERETELWDQQGGISDYELDWEFMRKTYLQKPQSLVFIQQAASTIKASGALREVERGTVACNGDDCYSNIGFVLTIFLFWSAQTRWTYLHGHVASFRDAVIENKSFDVVCERKKANEIRVSKNGRSCRVSITFWEDEVKWLLWALQ